MMGRPVLRKGFSWFLQAVFPKLPSDFQVLLIGPFRAKRPFSAFLRGLLPTRMRKQLELLFGMPSDEDNVRSLLASAALQGRVRHLGKLPFTDIMQIMSAADAFLMPNISVPGDMEGFGLVCLEANLRGLPVFAAKLEGITDAIHDHKNGWLLPSGNETAWITALEQLSQNMVKVHVNGQEARQYVLENFSWEKMTTGYYAHFLEMLNKF